MCLMCEQEEMLAAYREFLARRAAKAAGEVAADDAAPAAGVSASVSGTPDDDAWAAGTWFDVKIAPKE